MRALVLFKGTGSIDRALEEHGFEVTSLDILPKFGATFTEDILTWNYRQFEPGYFDFIWASPVCTEFSVALTTRPRDLELRKPSKSSATCSRRGGPWKTPRAAT